MWVRRVLICICIGMKEHRVHKTTGFLCPRDRKTLPIGKFFFILGSLALLAPQKKSKNWVVSGSAGMKEG